MERSREIDRRSRAAAWGAVLAALAFVALAVPPAQAADEYLFDPVLSLEGDCNGEDGVKDPGCPYQPPPQGPRPFDRPCGVAVDRYGSTYVANPVEGTSNGRIDVFDPQGKFLVEIPDAMEPCRVAVDSVGNLYVVQGKVEIAGEFELAHVVRYQPDMFPPGPGVEYSQAAKFEFVVRKLGKPADKCAQPQSVAIDPSNDHLYISKECYVEEYGSAAEGSPLLECCIGQATLEGKIHIGRISAAVYGRNHDVYVTANIADGIVLTSRVFLFDGTTGETTCELKGTGVEGDPEVEPKFDFVQGGAITVDQADGELFVYDLGHGVIDRFELDGEGWEECPQYSYAGKTPPPTNDEHPLFEYRWVNIAIDGPCRTGAELSESCDLAEYKSPNQGELYVTVGNKPTNSHLHAFKVRKGGPPEVRAQTAGGITESEAVLEAEVNPNARQTSYRFEYTTEADFEQHGYANAIATPAADAGNGGAFLAVTAPLTGLEPGVAYRYRLVADNCADPEAEPGLCLSEGEGVPGGEGLDASFSTYPEPAPSSRAYELVTPPDTGGHSLTLSMVGDEFSFSGFPTTAISPDGESVAFGSRLGSLPGIGGGGFQDTYEARRDDASGWRSAFTGLSAAQAEGPRLGGISPEHRYAFWYVFPGDRGTLVDGGAGARFLRVPAATASSPNCAVPGEPEGRLEWIACGELGFDRGANPTRGMLISHGGGHVVFETPTRLQDCAPPTGTMAIYDRSPGGETRCVSLLPGELTPDVGAHYRGTSADGSAVAFSIAETLYVRLGDSETVEVAAGNPAFGGISADGSRLFYVKGGDAFAFDTGTEETVKVGGGGESTLSYISADGSHAFFVSPKQLDGAEGQAGKDNLYAWDGAAVDFVATLDPLDVSGEGIFGPGLGKWLGEALNPDGASGHGPANVSARATPDGTVFVFESRADLGGYESNGRRQVYHYEESAPAGERLLCLSCNPTGLPTAAAGQLQSLPATDAFSAFPPLSGQIQIANVTVDGERVFFQSAEALVSADVDGRQDVYEWRAPASGGCTRPPGCLALISSGRSASEDYLYAMTPDGSDVLFLSGDTLVPQDPDGTPSLYDAREGGGFPAPAPPPGECLGEACQPAVSAPDAAAPASRSFQGPGNPSAKRPARARRCQKGKRRVRRAGKARCVKRRRHSRRGGAR